ncbi:MAG: HD-GYP domain-containing protein [Clostridiaceae bacterium]|nr:HD-GYP domain-containing protein [Clostridiaceae bacterium]
MKTIKIMAKAASPDMTIAEDVYTYGGQLIVPKGTVLDNRTITRIKFYSISEITILVENEAVQELDFQLDEAACTKDEMISRFAERNRKRALAHEDMEPEYLDIIRGSREYEEFNKDVFESALVLENSLSTFITRAGENLDTNELLNHTKDIIVMNRNPMNTFHMLQNVRKYDDATFIHCLNVAIICNVFGRWIHMPQDDIDVLTLAGLLHDVGKMMIPENIIKKPEFLTEAEYSVVKLHPKRGYNLLESMRIDERIKNVALMHHERCDGSGYPDGLKGNQIDEFAKIVAIADIYDAMTSARVYRGPLCPFEVINVFEAEGYEKFEPKYIIPFLEGIVNSYLNAEVLLSDGRKGVVVLNNKNALSRPVVRVGSEFIDLSKEDDLSIHAIA